MVIQYLYGKRIPHYTSYKLSLFNRLGYANICQTRICQTRQIKAKLGKTGPISVTPNLVNTGKTRTVQLGQYQ